MSRRPGPQRSCADRHRRRRRVPLPLRTRPRGQPHVTKTNHPRRHRARTLSDAATGWHRERLSVYSFLRETCANSRYRDCITCGTVNGVWGLWTNYWDTTFGTGLACEFAPDRFPGASGLPGCRRWELVGGLRSQNCADSRRPMTRNDVVRAARALERWGHERNWRGPDPYDGLNATPILIRRLRGSRLGLRLLTQVVKRSPLDLRPVFRVPPGLSPATLGLVISAYSRNGFVAQDEARDKLRRAVTQLETLRCPTFPEPCWGYHSTLDSRVLLPADGAEHDCYGVRGDGTPRRL